jgi:hypothetical protein
MRRLLAATAFLFLLALTPDVEAQQLRYIVIDGMAAAPAIVETNLVALDRPTITRTGVGSYTLTFRFPIRFFNGNVQRGGPNHDASQMLFSSVFATNNLRVMRVATYSLSPGNPTRTAPADGRLSILVVR